MAVAASWGMFAAAGECVLDAALRWAAATCAARLATTSEAAVTLLHAQLAVGIVGGLRVARGVERGGFGWAEMQVSGAKIGLQLPGRAGAEDRRGHRWPIAHPRQRDLGHGHAALLGDLLHRVDDVPGAPRAPPVVGLHATVRVLAQAGGTRWPLVALVLARQPAAAERTPW